MLASASPTARTAALRIWEIASGSEVRPLPGGSVSQIVFGSGGRSLVTADDRDRLVTWDLATRMPALGPYPRVEDRDFGGHGAAFTADGRVYGTCGGIYNQSRVLDVMTGKDLGQKFLTLYIYGSALALASGEKPLAASERGGDCELCDRGAVGEFARNRRIPLRRLLSGWTTGGRERRGRISQGLESFRLRPGGACSKVTYDPTARAGGRRTRQICSQRIGAGTSLPRPVAMHCGRIRPERPEARLRRR